MPQKVTSPRLIKGRFNGTVVILEEPAPVMTEVAVTVTFPASTNVSNPPLPRRFHWVHVDPSQTEFEPSISDELIRQRRRS